MGNPTSYRGWTLAWQGGRQLASASKNSTSLSFVYNHSGLRVEKTVSGTVHRYVYLGTRLAAEFTGDYALYFHYDAKGSPMGFTYDTGTASNGYLYRKNLQGDIIGVLSASGASVAEYRYDAWGRILSATGTMAAINPLRYRAYYFDQECSLYYLHSRYYDPEVCRFINADSFASTDQGIIGYNMFAYCNNNPVNRADPSGKLSLGPAVCFLLEWIFGNGGMVVFSDGSSIVEQLRASPKMNTYVKKAIDNYINGQPITAGTGEFTQKEDGYDLFLSTQHFEYAVYVSEDTFRVSVFGWEIEKTRFNATVFVHDTYNFDEYRQWNSFGNIMNNLAFAYHSIGGGNDFEWFAIYTYSTGWLSHM